MLIFVSSSSLLKQRSTSPPQSLHVLNFSTMYASKPAAEKVKARSCDCSADDEMISVFSTTMTQAIWHQNACLVITLLRQICLINGDSPHGYGEAQGRCRAKVRATTCWGVVEAISYCLRLCSLEEWVGCTKMRTELQATSSQKVSMRPHTKQIQRKSNKLFWNIGELVNSVW